MAGLVKITEYDIKNPILLNRAELLRQREHIDPLNDSNLFKAAVYGVLTARENYGKLKWMVHNLDKTGLNTPEAIKSTSIEELNMIVPIDKAHHISNLAHWWRNESNDISNRIIEDCSNGKSKSKELWEELLTAPGIRYKCANLLLEMAGYDQVVTADLWVLRYLHDNGCETIDFNKLIDIRGPSKSQFLIAQEEFSTKAKEYSWKPAPFKRLLWAKYSTLEAYEPDPNQIDLFSDTKLL